MEERRMVSWDDIAEIKSDGKLTLNLVREIVMKFSNHDTAQLSLERTVDTLALAVFGDGTRQNPGHISETNHRLETLENTQKSYSRVIWIVVTPLLSAIGLGIIVLLVQVLAAK
jgi:hypothetical protein